MNTIRKSTLPIWVAVMMATTIVADPADLIVTNFSFWPSGIEPQSYPDRLRFTLGNYGPLANCDVQLEFVLSRNTTLGDADDQPLASLPFSYCLDPGTGVIAELTSAERSQLLIPVDASGQYYVLLRVMPTGNTEPDPSDNVIVATNLLTVVPAGPMHVNLSGSSIITSNMDFYPGPFLSSICITAIAGGSPHRVPVSQPRSTRQAPAPT